MHKPPFTDPNTNAVEHVLLLMVVSVIIASTGTVIVTLPDTTGTSDIFLKNDDGVCTMPSHPNCVCHT